MYRKVLRLSRLEGFPRRKWAHEREFAGIGRQWGLGVGGWLEVYEVYGSRRRVFLTDWWGSGVVEGDWRWKSWKLGRAEEWNGVGSEGGGKVKMVGKHTTVVKYRIIVLPSKCCVENGQRKKFANNRQTTCAWCMVLRASEWCIQHERATRHTWHVLYNPTLANVTTDTLDTARHHHLTAKSPR